MSGRFIVLEGPDGSGTTLHTAMLAEHLRNKGTEVVQTCEPTDGPVGGFIREHLKKEGLPPDTLQLLFTADRSWHLAKDVLPALERGATVVSDRYWLSTVVYAEALGINSAALEQLNRHFVQPDAQILLLPPFEICLERLGKRGERDILEGDSLQKKVYEAYKLWTAKEGIPIVDSSGSIDETAQAILALLP
jgi:dTMP kinase